MSSRRPRVTRSYDLGNLLFRTGLLLGGAAIVASLTVTLIDAHRSGGLAYGAPLASLESAQVLPVSNTRGAFDPLLATGAGQARAVVTERDGACRAFGPQPTLASSVALTVPGEATASGIRTSPYCAGAELPTGALAFAAVSPSGIHVVGTLSSAGTVTNGAPLPGPTIVFGPMWLTSTPSGVYLDAETEGSHGECCDITVWHSTDGVTYSPPATLAEPAGQKADPATFYGPVSVDPTSTGGGAASERLYVPYSHNDGGQSERDVRLSVSSDGGATFVDRDVVEESEGYTVAAQYPEAAVDAAGNVYVVWSDIGQVFYSWSKDRGVTMSVPVSIDRDTQLNVMPQIVAGDPGHIAIAWYAGTGRAAMGPGSESDQWRALLAVSGNAAGPNPSIARVTLSAGSVHAGSICLLGEGCTDGGQGGLYDSRLGAHLGLALDPTTGGVEVAYAGDAGPNAPPAVRLVREHCGERILVRPPNPLPSCG